MEKLLLEASATIDGLSKLCKELINELAQYKSIEKEEQKFNDIKEKGYE